ncbi:hypothetical protein T484DRAFT_1870811, partial [Baffinella frigidus]
GASVEVSRFDANSTIQDTSFEVSRFDANSTIQARYDLEYAHACVCSPEALCLFTDEFDWQDLHNDFVPGLCIKG